MMNIANANTESEILTELGSRLKAFRIARQWQQQELADHAGINRTTLSKFENGKGGRLDSLIKLLRSLNRLDALAAFLPEPTISPLALAKAKRKRPPQRVRK